MATIYVRKRKCCLFVWNKGNTMQNVRPFYQIITMGDTINIVTKLAQTSITQFFPRVEETDVHSQSFPHPYIWEEHIDNKISLYFVYFALLNRTKNKCLLCLLCLGQKKKNKISVYFAHFALLKTRRINLYFAYFAS